MPRDRDYDPMFPNFPKHIVLQIVTSLYSFLRDLHKDVRFPLPWTFKKTVLHTVLPNPVKRPPRESGTFFTRVDHT